jgi:hypothetical protein
MLKNWFLLASVSYGIGCGFSFLASRDLQHSLRAGAGTVPAVVVSISILARQRRQEIERQVAITQHVLGSLQEQQRQLTQKIQAEEVAHQNLSTESQQLRELLATLNQSADRNGRAQQAIQQEIEALDRQRAATQQSLQALQEKLDAQHSTELEFQQTIYQSQIQIQEYDQQLQAANEKADFSQQQVITAAAKLQEIEEATVQSWQSQAIAVQSQQDIEEIVAELVERQKALVKQVYAETEKCGSIASEIDQLTAQRTEIHEQIQRLNEIVNEKQLLLNDLKINLIEKQTLLDNSDNSLAERQEIASNIFDLQAQQNKQQGILQDLQSKVQSQQALATSLTEEVTAKFNELASLQSQIACLQSAQSLKSEETECLVPDNSVESLVIAPEFLSLPTLEESIQNNSDKEDRLFWNSMGLGKRQGLYASQELVKENREDFMNSLYTEKIWNDQILPYWIDRDKEAGHRFLGNVMISKDESDRIISIVGENLRQLRKFSAREAEHRFEANKNWLKILTFAASEYAYYYSDEDRFWDGLCNCWGLKRNQVIQGELRKLVSQGIALLRLVEAVEGYPCVSTLWLQNGISKRNSGHFATILIDLSREVSWSELAGFSPKEISSRLKQRCEERYPSWRTVLQFLRYCCFDCAVRPIAGEIVQGIIQSLSTNSFGLVAEVCRDFGRVQEELIDIIGCSRLSLSKVKEKRIESESISLDLDELNILNIDRKILRYWDWVDEIEQLPCLIFDGESGCLLPVNSKDQQLIYRGNLFCFIPFDVEFRAEGSIQILDRNIPCSLMNWQGYELNLAEGSGGFSLRQGDELPFDVSWHSVSARVQLVGTQSVQNNQKYLDIPTLWLPPLVEKTTAHVTLEESQGKKFEETITLEPNSKWQEVPKLQQWLQEASSYRLQVKGDSIDYQTKFIVSEPLTALPLEKASFAAVNISIDDYQLGEFSRSYSQIDGFLAATASLKNLWPLETILFILKANGEELMHCSVQADKSGIVEFKMTEFYSAMIQDNSYAVFFHREGESTRRIVDVPLMF